MFFESFHGKQYSDNPRAIYEYIRENYPEYTCIWAVKKGFEAPFIENDVPYVRRMG
ncbi:CDP-glycerol glycerophosphotransferase family protein, partial [Enterococcus thailandicus]|uniref:CDP-glycerol glycerophosphotransferase family protein n=1 Tax=Enterococcus thailandicus TaxID=417368 RepID=UPI0021184C36